MAHLVLIGPIGVGKSTVAPIVASLTGRATVSVDEVRFEHYRRAGYDDARADAFLATGDVFGLTRYWKPFEADALEHLVRDHTDVVLDLGAGHADYPDGPLLDRVATALAEHFVVLLMPSGSVEESVDFLRPRVGDQAEVVHELNRTFVESRSFRLLADTTVLVAGLTPDEVAAEVVRRWESARPPG
jgi:shikimate kinase